MPELRVNTSRVPGGETWADTLLRTAEDGRRHRRVDLEHTYRTIELQLRADAERIRGNNEHTAAVEAAYAQLFSLEL